MELGECVGKNLNQAWPDLLVLSIIELIPHKSNISNAGNSQYTFRGFLKSEQILAMMFENALQLKQMELHAWIWGGGVVGGQVNDLCLESLTLPF